MLVCTKVRWITIVHKRDVSIFVLVSAKNHLKVKTCPYISHVLPCHLPLLGHDICVGVKGGGGGVGAG